MQVLEKTCSAYEFAESRTKSHPYYGLLCAGQYKWREGTESIIYHVKVYISCLVQFYCTLDMWVFNNVSVQEVYSGSYVSQSDGEVEVCERCVEDTDTQ